jgi:hypothetical protein
MFSWRVPIGLIAAYSLLGCSPGPDAPAELAVPHLRQETLLCVPTSAAMILAFYGDPQPPRRLKALASGRDYDPRAVFSDFSITPFRGLISAVSRLGYEWREQSLPNDDAGFTTGIEIIRSELAQGHPVMVDLSIPTGHTVVVAGIDMNSRTVALVDPGQPPPGKVALSFDQLQGYWNERAYDGNFRSLILTRRKAV